MQDRKHLFVNDVQKHINSYMDYLCTAAGLYVSVQHPAGEFDVFGKKADYYTQHRNPYCKYIKANSGLMAECTCNRSRVMQECASRNSFFGCCFAGVYEFVYPVKNSAGDTVWFISVSGYRQNNPQPPAFLDRIADKYTLDPAVLKHNYMSCLSPDIPDKAYIDSLVTPLSDMLTLLMIKSPDSGAGNVKRSRYSAYTEILLYLREHYNENITVKLLAQRFHYSQSYISHLFKSFNGYSISRYINSLRVDYAKNYLLNTDLPVAEIAYSVGYMDPNYFSKVYKSLEGISPMQERSHAEIPG